MHHTEVIAPANATKTPEQTREVTSASLPTCSHCLMRGTHTAGELYAKHLLFEF